jgi:predicted acyltransferase (DUF342 family)
MSIESTHALDGVTLRIVGDLRLDDGQRVAGALVVRGDVHVGPGAEIAGSVKAHGSVAIAPGACVRGTIVSTRNVTVARGARVEGSILAELAVELESQVVVGAPDARASVIADRVRLGVGCVVHGTVIAREEGSVG